MKNYKNKQMWNSIAVKMCVVNKLKVLRIFVL